MFKPLQYLLSLEDDDHKDVVDSRGTNDPKTFTTAVLIMTSAHGRRGHVDAILPTFSGHVDLMAVLWLLVLRLGCTLSRAR